MLGKISTSIIVSDGEMKEIHKYGIVSGHKINNINNAIDFNEYRQIKEMSNIRKELGINDNQFVVAAIGRLVPQKNYETFICAAKEVISEFPDVIFLIVGDGELFDQLKSYIVSLGLNSKIKLTGYVKEIHKIYLVIDVLVNTSLWEGLPYTFIEAYSYNKPVIATDTGNGHIILNAKTGFVSPRKDIISIAERIKELIMNKDLSKEMGINGNKLIKEKYSFQLFIKEHEKLYLEHIIKS